MIDQKIKLITGSLLHDIGKVVYREGSDRRNHSVSGYDFLKEEGKIEDKEILDCVRYHHFSEIKSARLKEDNLAYIGEKRKTLKKRVLICQSRFRVCLMY